jgi:hypothetical protein
MKRGQSPKEKQQQERLISAAASIPFTKIHSLSRSFSHTMHRNVK